MLLTYHYTVLIEEAKKLKNYAVMAKHKEFSALQIAEEMVSDNDP